MLKAGHQPALSESSVLVTICWASSAPSRHFSWRSQSGGAGGRAGHRRAERVEEGSEIRPSPCSSRTQSDNESSSGSEAPRLRSPGTRRSQALRNRSLAQAEDVAVGVLEPGPASRTDLGDAAD